MLAFKDAKHLCSWTGAAPQNNESEGNKKRRGHKHAIITITRMFLTYIYNVLLKIEAFATYKLILLQYYLLFKTHHFLRYSCYA